MKKQINATGVNGTFTGEISVNYNLIAATNLYDDNLEVQIRKGETYIHIVGTVCGRCMQDIICTGESSIFKGVRDAEAFVAKELELLANLDPVCSIESQLKAKGFV